MVLEFLNSYEQELQTLLFEKTEDLDLVSTKILETEKLMKLIQSENSEVFTDFTPRTISDKNADKISELNCELEELTNQKENLSKEIEVIEKKLKDLKSSLEEIQSFEDIVPTSEKNVSRETSSSGINLKDKLYLVLTYLPQDPLRAKIELESIIKSFS